MQMGMKPSLPRTLARLGSHRTRILPRLYTTCADADKDEHSTEKALSPNLHGITPYSGPRQVEWLSDDVRVPDNKPVALLWPCCSIRQPTVCAVVCCTAHLFSNRV